MTRAVLVTGARGYLGGRLMLGLADDPALSVMGTTRGAPLPPTGWPAECPFLHCDPLNDDDAALDRVLGGIDTIVHLSAANEFVSAASPLTAMMDTGVATLKLLKAARRAGCRRFIFLSTIHVYGSPLAGRIVETDVPRPVHPYAVSHRNGEDWVLAARAARDIEGVVVRLSNGIGAPAWPGIDRWTLIGNELCQRVVREGRVALKGSGRQWRDFILLRDFVSGMRHLIGLPPQALGDGLFNLGGRLPLQMIEIAETIARRATAMFGRAVAVEHPAPAPGEPYPPLDFVIDRIAATGFAPSPREALDDEIDATLALCKAASAA